MDAILKVLFLTPASLNSWGSDAVIFGLIGDIIVLLFCKKKPFLEEVLGVAFIAVIIVGLWMEGVADRWLAAARLPSDSELAMIAAKLEPFSGTKFDIGMPLEGREAWDFVWKLEPAISKGGWTLEDWKGGLSFGKTSSTTHTLRWYGFANVEDVSIEVDRPKANELLPAGRALAGALKSIGIIAGADITTDNSTSQNAEAVHILIGPKTR